jgi:ABC-type uncharacterized transport system auxiliary subunit
MAMRMSLQPQRRHILAVAALLLVAALLAGCGGSKSPTRTSTASTSASAGNRYVGQLNQAQLEFQTTIARLSEPVKQISPVQARARLVNIQHALQEVVTRISRIKPPPTVAALHAQLTREIASFSAQFKAFTRSVASGNRAKIASAHQALVRGSQALAAHSAATIAQINSALHG